MPTAQREARHDLPRRLRGRPAEPGDRAPTRARARAGSPRTTSTSCSSTTSCGPSGPARSTTRSSASCASAGCMVHDFARRCSPRRSTSPAPGTFLQDRLTTADPLRAGAGRAARRARRVDAGAPMLAELLIGGVLKRDVAPLLHASSLLMEYLGRRRLPAARRCPTTCSSATTRPGSTAACRSTRWPSRPGKRETINSRVVYNFHPMFARRRHRLPLRQRRPGRTSRPPSRAATSRSSATAR